MNFSWKEFWSEDWFDLDKVYNLVGDKVSKAFKKVSRPGIDPYLYPMEYWEQKEDHMGTMEAGGVKRKQTLQTNAPPPKKKFSFFITPAAPKSVLQTNIQSGTLVKPNIKRVIQPPRGRSPLGNVPTTEFAKRSPFEVPPDLSRSFLAYESPVFSQEGRPPYTSTTRKYKDIQNVPGPRTTTIERPLKLTTYIPPASVPVQMEYRTLGPMKPIGKLPERTPTIFGGTVKTSTPLSERIKKEEQQRHIPEKPLIPPPPLPTPMKPSVLKPKVTDTLQTFYQDMVNYGVGLGIPVEEAHKETLALMHKPEIFKEKQFIPKKRLSDITKTIQKPKIKKEAKPYGPSKEVLKKFVDEQMALGTHIGYTPQEAQAMIMEHQGIKPFTEKVNVPKKRAPDIQAIPEYIPKKREQTYKPQIMSIVPVKRIADLPEEIMPTMVPKRSISQTHIAIPKKRKQTYEVPIEVLPPEKSLPITTKKIAAPKRSFGTFSVKTFLGPNTYEPSGRQRVTLKSKRPPKSKTTEDAIERVARLRKERHGKMTPRQIKLEEEAQIQRAQERAAGLKTQLKRKTTKAEVPKKRRYNVPVSLPQEKPIITPPPPKPLKKLTPLNSPPKMFVTPKKTSTFGKKPKKVNVRKAAPPPTTKRPPKKR